jgi:hypothetical protein
MRIIIFHGKKGSGKTTELSSIALCISSIKSFKQAKKAINHPHIIIDKYDNYYFWDDFSFDTDADKLPELLSLNISGLYLSTSQLPDDYEAVIHKYLGDVSDLNVRETMWPLCNYISIYDNKYYADFGGISHIYDSRTELIDAISNDRKEEVTIINTAEFLQFLDTNRNPPRGFSEWGFNYGHLMILRDKFINRTSDTILVTENEAIAVIDYNSMEIDWIEELFFKLFLSN